ncbi:Rieske 2Fe-2S domain-containing protein [Bartonella sp. HY406]|uniref:Rieske 2Fe-2S domain-containing protein n=1 Tax=Bartonella sp. HY406 TaxID=2979331 RepID=UPI0021C954E0|nr:Rieske 2Fe-2S domain-containing protein [Bartonella sp. HY406]UXN02491.1 Rieske 2Fe-2S domain-containing protein [Bartonella sp. HY406]
MTKHFWHAVYIADKLKKKPVRIMFEGEALVLFRSKDGIGCLKDMCPHRGASLSKGRVVNNTVECPYHGWRFDKKGACKEVPLYDGELPRRFLRNFTAKEHNGLIFITQDEESAGNLPEIIWDDQPYAQYIMENDAISNLADVVENVLDPIHTLFVHKGIVRGSNASKNSVTFTASVENSVLIIRHQGEEKQNGFLSRLLEPQRSHAINRFELPGTVSLEYYGKQGLSLCLTAYFSREIDNQYKGFAVFRGPKQHGLGYLKGLFLIPIMRKVISQDQDIMKDATNNRHLAGNPPYAKSPLDLFRPMIDRIIETPNELINLPEGQMTLLI